MNNKLLSLSVFLLASMVSFTSNANAQFGGLLPICECGFNTKEKAILENGCPVVRKCDEACNPVPKKAKTIEGKKIRVIFSGAYGDWMSEDETCALFYGLGGFAADSDTVNFNE